MYRREQLAVCFTSGTPGQAKVAVLSHEVPFLWAVAYNKVMRVTEEDTILIPLVGKTPCN